MRCSILAFLIVCIATASVSAQPAKSASEAGTYEKNHWGFKVALPKSWKVYSDVDLPKQFRGSFGMPKIWSEKENAYIENAVSVSVYRGKSLATVNDVLRLEESRIADILITKKTLPVKMGIAFDSRTRINRLEYMSRTICRFDHGLGYLFTFTATDGTFEQNLPAFEKFVANVSFEQPRNAPQYLSERNHYDLAREYYKLGPSHAKTVITELEQHVALEQDDDKAFILLGVTQKGIGEFDDALKSFEEAERIARAKKSINPRLLMLRAECHFHKKEFQKARDILKPMWAFFQNDDKQIAQYEAMMSSIDEQLKKMDAPN